MKRTCKGLQLIKLPGIADKGSDKSNIYEIERWSWLHLMLKVAGPHVICCEQIVSLNDNNVVSWVSATRVQIELDSTSNSTRQTRHNSHTHMRYLKEAGPVTKYDKAENDTTMMMSVNMNTHRYDLLI